MPGDVTKHNWESKQKNQLSNCPSSSTERRGCENPCIGLPSRTYLRFAIHGFRAFFWVNASSQERSLPRIDVVLSFTRKLEGFPILTNVSSLGVVDCEHLPTAHETSLHVPELEVVQGQHVFFVPFLRTEMSMMKTIWKSKAYKENLFITSSSLYQDKDSEVRTNQ